MEEGRRVNGRGQVNRMKGLGGGERGEQTGLR